MEKYYKVIATHAMAFLIVLIKTVLVVPHGACRFSPSCSEYAMKAIVLLPLHRALVAIASRLIRCTPVSMFGLDPVPKLNRKDCVRE